MFHAPRLRTLLVALVCAVATTGAHAQVPDPNLWGTDGAVRAFARSGNTLYVGGEFSQVLPPDPIGWARVDATSGQPVMPTPITDGPVRAVEPDGSGGYYIGGSFSMVGGQPRLCLARVRANGTIAPLSIPIAADAIGGGVRALKLEGSTLYVGGGFQAASGRLNAFAVDLGTGTILPWNPSPYLGFDYQGAVYAIETLGNRVFLAGDFAHVGGANVSYFAEVDGWTGTNVPGMPTAGFTRRLLRVASKLYLAGTFDHVGGLARQNYAAVNLISKAVTSWAPTPNVVPGNDPNLQGLAWDGATRIFVLGGFSTINGVARNRIAAVDTTTGAVVTTWSPPTFTLPPFPAPLFDIAWGSGKLYVSGLFSHAGVDEHLHLARLDGILGTPDPWAANLGYPSGSIQELAVDGSVVIVAGAGIRYGLLDYGLSNLAAFDLVTGTLRTTFMPSVQGVHALALANGKLYAAGDGFVRRLDPLTGETEMTHYADDIVRALVVDGSTLYAGGDFQQVDGFPVPYLAAIEDDFNEADWLNAPNDVVRSLVLDAGTLYAGGDFTQAGVDTRDHIAAFSTPSGSLVATTGFSAAASVHALALDGGLLYGAMGNGQARRWDTSDGSVHTSWDPSESGALNTIALDSPGNLAYLGGAFTPQNLSTWSLDEPPVSAGWTAATDGEVFTLLKDGTDIFVGGTFGQITAGTLMTSSAGRGGPASATRVASGPVTALNLVRLTLEPLAPVGVGDPPPSASAALSFAAAFPSPCGSTTTLLWSLPASSSARLAVYDLAGRVVREPLRQAEQSAGPHRTELDVRGLAAGVYFARLETRFRSATRRFIVAR